MVWGIIGALDTEVALIKEKMRIEDTKTILGSEYVIGTIGRQQVVTVCCNIGKINAAICTNTIIRELGADAVINIGVAGALHPSLNILDVVISENVILHDADLHILKECFPFREYYEADPKLIALCQKACEQIEHRNFQYYTGRIASGDRFIEDQDVKDRIIQTFSPWCVEMEGASVGQVAFMNQKPFLIIRSISDKADDGAYEVYDNFVDLAAHNSAQIVLNMLEQYAE